MAIVKARYVRIKDRIKAHLRYITHRRGVEGERITRPLFGRDGALSKQHIYDMIDATRRGAVAIRAFASVGNTYMLLEWYHNPSVSRFPSGF